MTTYRVRSTDGNNADNGSTWALAKLDLAGFAAVDAAGDTAYVSQVHAESTAGNVTVACAGTPASPTKIVCGNDGADPPTAVATSATVTVNLSGGAFAVTGTVYVAGLTVICGTGIGNPAITLGGGTGWQKYENCKFQLAGTGGAGVIRPNTAGSGGVVQWNNCEVKFAASGQGLQFQNGYFHWNGGGITSGGTSPTSLVANINTAGNAAGLHFVIENCDFSTASAGMNLIGAQVPYGNVIVFRNCRLPNSWSGAVCSAFTSNSMGRIEIYNCNDAASSVNYKLKIVDGCGNIDQETALVKTAGASDGTTSIAWKMVSGAQCSYPAAALYSPEIAYWNEQVGVSKTATLDILRDSATNLTDSDVWVELNYAGSSSTPACTLITDRTADILAAAADQTASSVTWTTTGMANPNKQALSVAFVPQAKGWITMRVALAKASTTIYVDPKVVLT